MAPAIGPETEPFGGPTTVSLVVPTTAPTNPPKRQSGQQLSEPMLGRYATRLGAGQKRVLAYKLCYWFNMNSYI